MSEMSIRTASKPTLVLAGFAALITVTIDAAQAAPATPMPLGQLAAPTPVEHVQYRGYRGGFRGGYSYRGGYGWGGGPFFAGATLGLLNAGYGWGGYPYGGYYPAYGYGYGYPYARVGFYRPNYGYAPFYGPRRVGYGRPFGYRGRFVHSGFRGGYRGYYHPVRYRF